MCEFCEKGVPLVIGKTNDQGIAIRYPNRLIAYGYDIHGSGPNGLMARIQYCPMCGKRLYYLECKECARFMDENQRTCKICRNKKLYRPKSNDAKFTFPITKG